MRRDGLCVSRLASINTTVNRGLLCQGLQVLPTGLRDMLPAVDGMSERWARDVLHCPYCHGH
jgi:hypothetical protein